MDLRGGAITLGEIVGDPGARKLVEREFPGLLRHPFARSFMGMPLGKALRMARGRFPEDSIERVLNGLRELQARGSSAEDPGPLRGRRASRGD